MFNAAALNASFIQCIALNKDDDIINFISVYAQKIILLYVQCTSALNASFIQCTALNTDDDIIIISMSAREVYAQFIKI